VQQLRGDPHADLGHDQATLTLCPSRVRRLADLGAYPEVARRFSAFITASDVLAKTFEQQKKAAVGSRRVTRPRVTPRAHAPAVSADGDHGDCGPAGGARYRNAIRQRPVVKLV
jgi:hypothetical protein